MCKHICDCGTVWSHQDFPTSIVGGIARFDPCSFPELYDAKGNYAFARTRMCPTCYEEKKRWRHFSFPVHKWDRRTELCIRCGADLTPDTEHTRCDAEPLGRLSFEEYKRNMDAKQNNGHLTPREIAEAQLEEEGVFNLFVQNMDDEKRHEHYLDLCRKLELFRTKLLRFNQLERDYEIERLQNATDEERAAFEEAKRRRAARKAESEPRKAAVRQSKEDKMVRSFAEKLMAGNPELSEEDAIARAKKMFA